MQEQPISRLVETIVSENPLYMMMISTGIANLSALAKEVLPLIMSTTDRPVKLGTIIKALERMEAKNKVTMPNMFQLMSEAEIMVHSGIGEAEIMVGDVKPELLNELGHDAAIIISDGTRLKLIAPPKDIQQARPLPNRRVQPDQNSAGREGAGWLRDHLDSINEIQQNLREARPQVR